MYFQKDYVLRMIEMVGELMRRICAIAREADARRELEEVSQKACGMPIAMLRTMEPETAAHLLDEPQRFLAAELLRIDIEIRRRVSTDDMLLPIQAQVLSLYATLTEPDYVLPAAEHGAALLSETLAQLPLEPLLAAADLCERGDRLADAEDALFAALELAPSEKPRLLAFYGRLDALGDNALRAGGLSREEVAEGRAALN